MPLIKLEKAGESWEHEYTELPFPPLTRSHVLNCSYHSWYPRYRSLTPKARLIALSPPFLSYLRADGIILPPSRSPSRRPSIPEPLTPPPSDSGSDSEDEAPDPSLEWRDIHEHIEGTIQELGGSVMPKLNWSAPKDATWINATNSMECRDANDVYMLLKSSDFITHDLEAVWEGCEASSSYSSSSDVEEIQTQRNGDASISNACGYRRNRDTKGEDVPYHLILRKIVPNWSPAAEFRCFVRARQLLCLCQRDLNYYAFLPALLPVLRSAIQTFFEEKLQRTFPDQDFVFDVYVPGLGEDKGEGRGGKRVWLVDVNPWAPRTDPLLFSWLEILTMEAPERRMAWRRRRQVESDANNVQQNGNGDSDVEDEEAEEEVYIPEFRLVNRDDPEAYAFNTPKYSAHKMPKDVVDAGLEGQEGLREFLNTWKGVVEKEGRMGDQDEDEDDNER